ncbi:MAG TPA: glycosyltransferase family 39 protein [Dictyobacter sp.]|jgi:hypothetical protein|nr:glycosyltransferase family 39 protein [Dictyobacter sp.]
MIQKIIHLSKRHSLVLFLLGGAIILRLIFMLNNWPATDSEEGTMGLEALHILQKGEHPIYFYGQYYMGVAEAYIGAVMFKLFGISIFSLRLGMLLLFLIFLILVYLLGSLLYNKKVALWTLALLAGGSEILLTPELKAVGGAAETLVCGTALQVLTSWIILRTIRGQATKKNYQGYAYGCWGFIAGFGLWSHLLVVPFILTSGTFLFLFCRKTLKKGTGWLMLIGFLIGASPLIIFNILTPQHNTIAVFWGLHQTTYPNAPTGITLWAKQIIGTFFYTLPLATGMLRFSDLQVVPGLSQFIHINELNALPLYGPLNWQSLIPIVFFGGWSTGFLALLFSSTKHSFTRTYLFWKKSRNNVNLSKEERLQFTLHALQCMLLLNGWLTIISFVTSATAAERPWSFRYLIGLLIITPALVAPLCQSRPSLQKRPVWKYIGIRTLITLALGIICLSTLQNFFELPQATTAFQNQTLFVHQLEQKHITHIYSGYWVCDRLIFASQENVICAVLNNNMQPGLTRYSQYQTIVRKDPQAAYVFTTNTDFDPQQAINTLKQNRDYQQFSTDGYIVFYPK